MSQFYGYTVDIVLKDHAGKTVRGIIESIAEHEVVLKNPVYIEEDGSYDKINKKEMRVKNVSIADLNVVELAKNNSKYIKKQMKMLKEQQSQSQDQSQPQSQSSELEKEPKRKERNFKNKNKKNNTSDGTNNNDSNTNINLETGSMKNDASKELEVKYVDIYNEKPSSSASNDNAPGKRLEEFDFASNLEKFDKESVFKDISLNDKTDKSARLVSFNKLDNKDKDSDKYSIDEMILKKKHQNAWDDNNTNYSYSNIVNPSSSKSDNTNLTTESNNSQMSDNLLIALQSRQTSFERKASLTPTFAQFFNQSLGDSPIPTCSTLQLSEILNLCKSRFNLTEQILNENSGRSLAELIINNIIGNFRINFKNHNEPPLVLLLIGNNKTGSITLSTGRHLFNRGLKTIAYLLYDAEHSEDELLLEVDEELKRYSNIGGKIVNNLNQLETVLKSMDGSPLEFILDGLQGFDTDLNDLIPEELNQAIKLIDWCNAQKLPIMSLDIPTGLNPSSGTTENEEVSTLNSRYIVSIGLPLSSALNIYKFGYFEKGKVSHYLVDCGIPRRVFGTKGSLRKFDRRWFADSSAIDMTVV